MSLPKLEPTRNVSSKVISNRIIASVSFASTGKCNSMFKSVGSLLRMEAFFLKLNNKLLLNAVREKKDFYEEGLDRLTQWSNYLPERAGRDLDNQRSHLPPQRAKNTVNEQPNTIICTIYLPSGSSLNRL